MKLSTNRILLISISCILVITFYGCNKTFNYSGPDKVYLGDDYDTLFESFSWNIMQKVKKGDIIATKYPGLFLDFNYSVAFNTYNSAIGKFVGWDRVIVTSKGESTLYDMMKKSITEQKK